MKRLLVLSTLLCALLLPVVAGLAAEDAKPTPLLAQVKAWLEKDEWNPTQDKKEPVLYTGFEGDNGTYEVHALVNEEGRQVLILSFIADKVPAKKRRDAAEYLMRANYGLMLGNFEMDYNDGEIRFRTSIDVEGGTLADKQIDTLVYSNVMTMDKYVPGLKKVLDGKATPEKAIKEVESPAAG